MRGAPLPQPGLVVQFGYLLRSQIVQKVDAFDRTCLLFCPGLLRQKSRTASSVLSGSSFFRNICKMSAKNLPMAAS
jgi:hypothetical protein